MALTFRQLRYFLVLAEDLHFGRAAKRLHISQPPLSASLRQLEEELGVKLLERSSKHVALTPAGEVFQREARRLLENLEASQNLVQRIASSASGVVRMGFTPAMIFRHLPAMLRQLEDAHPGIEVQLIERNSAEQLAALQARQLDLAFIHAMPLPDGIASLSIAEDPFLACLPPHHPLASRRSLTLRDLAGEPLIMFSRNLAPHYYDRIISQFHLAGLEPQIRHQVTHWLTIMALVAHGMGVSLVPKALTGARFRQEVFLPIEDAPAHHQSLCIWPRDQPNPSRDLVIEVITQCVEATAPPMGR